VIPRISQADGQIGFYWVTPDGQPATLPDLIATGTGALRLLPTHLSALDDALIDAAGRWGEVLGGGRPVRDFTEAAELTELCQTLERLNREYADAERLGQRRTEIRAGQIIGTSALLAIRARMATDAAGPVPFSAELAEPGHGVMSGHGQFHWVPGGRVSAETRKPSWRGGRWVLVASDGRRYPLTLAMVLAGSGTEKDGALDEHRAALRALTEIASGSSETRDATPDADRAVLAGALEWLLYDWLMAHRESERSAAIEIRSGRTADAAMIVAAAAALATARRPQAIA
jgi:hypothetical protein